MLKTCAGHTSYLSFFWHQQLKRWHQKRLYIRFFTPQKHAKSRFLDEKCIDSWFFDTRLKNLTPAPLVVLVTNMRYGHPTTVCTILHCIEQCICGILSIKLWSIYIGDLQVFTYSHLSSWLHQCILGPRNLMSKVPNFLTSLFDKQTAWNVRKIEYSLCVKWHWLGKSFCLYPN